MSVKNGRRNFSEDAQFGCLGTKVRPTSFAKLNEYREAKLPEGDNQVAFICGAWQKLLAVVRRRDSRDMLI